MKFDPLAVKESLGIGLSAWDVFIGNLKQLSRRPISSEETRHYFRAAIPEVDDGIASKAMQQVTALYSGAGGEVFAAVAV